jgi:succinate dehydrogenase / fumarate reductase flavoprotein subunit
MGGIPTDKEGRVLADGKGTLLHGFYAAGECACVSVHGANRLGTNSLLDLVVFGRRAGNDIAGTIQSQPHEEFPVGPEKALKARVEGLLHSTGRERLPLIRQKMQETMMEWCSVFRDQKGLKRALGKIKMLRERYGAIGLSNKGRRFNYELVEAFELGHMLAQAEVTVASALAREESRGAHFREDFPERDDHRWLKHTLAYETPKGPRITDKPVTITQFEPKPRTY